MNGAPGGSRQSEKAPPEGGPPSTRAPTQQPMAILPQHQESTSSSQQGIVPPPFAGVVPQASSLRESSFPASAVQQHPAGWPSQFDIQQLHHSAQVAAAAAAGLRYPQPSTSQPVSGPEMTVGASPLSSLPSPATPSASLLTGIGLSPGSAPATGPGSAPGPGPSSAGQTPLQMLSTMNPALLAQYQVILAAAAAQQQQVAVAAASLAAASGAHSPQIGSHVGPPSAPSLTLEQNLQRYLLQLQQQQQQQQQQQLAISAGAASHLLPSSPLHGTTTPLIAQMHAALAAVGVLPPAMQALPAHTTAPTAAATHPRVTPAAVTQQMPSPSAEITSRQSRVEFLQPQPLLSRITAAAAARQPSLLAATSHTVAAAAATTTTAPSTLALQAASTSQPYSQAHGRVILMPPPSLPRARHASAQERRRHAPYQRPAPVIPSASAASTSGISASAAPPEPSSFQLGTIPSQPYYPSHFMRGTVIRLQSGQLKRVEEMSTEDFVLSAAMKTDLILCNSTVVRIQEIEKDRQVLVTFAVGEQRIQVTIEAGIEHPYFVVGHGWASCSPERTRTTYGLICRQLNVGDVCITLRHSERGEASGTSGRGISRHHSVTRGGPAPGTSGMQHSSRSAHSIHSPRRHSLSTIRFERRSGVRSAPARESLTEELNLLEIRRRLKRCRHKSVL